MKNKSFENGSTAANETSSTAFTLVETGPKWSPNLVPDDPLDNWHRYQVQSRLTSAGKAAELPGPVREVPLRGLVAPAGAELSWLQAFWWAVCGKRISREV